MLNSKAEVVLHDVNEFLTALGSKAATSLAGDVRALLKANAQQRAQMADRAKAQRGKARGGRPALDYMIELEPGWRAVATGARAALAKAEQACASVGQPRRAPTLAALQMAMSRKGAWTALLETDNGTVSLSVRRVAETGTDLAPSKERASPLTK